MAEGDHIGLFPASIRIRMRARIWAARKWERAHDNVAMFAGPDMRAQKASWQAFAAEAANLGGVEHAQSLLNLVMLPRWFPIGCSWEPPGSRDTPMPS